MLPGKALEWYQRALDGREKTLGKDHVAALGTVHNMAIVYKNQGDHGKALEWYQRALEGRARGRVALALEDLLPGYGMPWC